MKERDKTLGEKIPRNENEKIEGGSRMRKVGKIRKTEKKEKNDKIDRESVEITERKERERMYSGISEEWRQEKVRNEEQIGK